ncbi:MAG: hypothetical protein ACRERE_31620, partial [Candidatus Entotheonellia bacterium]
FGRGPAQASGLTARGWTAACVDRRPRRWKRGKGCNARPIATILLTRVLALLVERMLTAKQANGRSR